LQLVRPLRPKQGGLKDVGLDEEGRFDEKGRIPSAAEGLCWLPIFLVILDEWVGLNCSMEVDLESNVKCLLVFLALPNRVRRVHKTD
jgi:hypothetical protein